VIRHQLSYASERNNHDGFQAGTCKLHNGRQLKAILHSKERNREKEVVEENFIKRNAHIETNQAMRRG
jgi:hypothetical protein